MKTLITPILASATLIAAVPALAASDSETNSTGVCAGAYMRADKNDDGSYSRDEVDALRNAEFGQLDVNQDGSIDREEYVSCMKGARDAEQSKSDEFKDSNEFEMNRWLDLTSADQMSREEYAAFAEEAWEEGDEMKKDSVARLNDDERDNVESFANAAAKRFRLHDTDGNGVITQEEYEASDRAADLGDTSLEKRFDDLDADGSGAISPQEYRPAGVWAHGALGSDRNTTETDGSTGSASAETGAAESGSDTGSGQMAEAQDADKNGGISIIRYHILTY